MKVLSILAGLVLGPVSLFFLFNAGDAHVAMCMLGAVLISIAFIWNAIKPSGGVQKTASFAAGWIFFYTIAIATTFLIFEWYKGTGSFDPSSPLTSVQPVYIYHFFINFVVLLIFWLKLKKIKAFLLGNIFALILSPLMLLFVKFADWPSSIETSTTLVVYVVLGVMLLVLYLVYLKKILGSEKVSTGFETFFKVVLWIYVFLSATLLVVSIFRPEGILKNTNQNNKNFEIHDENFQDQPYDSSNPSNDTYE